MTGGGGLAVPLRISRLRFDPGLSLFLAFDSTSLTVGNVAYFVEKLADSPRVLTRLRAPGASGLGVAALDRFELMSRAVVP
jgi:hypothetical protein